MCADAGFHADQTRRILANCASTWATRPRYVETGAGSVDGKLSGDAHFATRRLALPIAACCFRHCTRPRRLLVALAAGFQWASMAEAEPLPLLFRRPI